MSETIMVVRGVDALGIPVAEVPELIQLLSQFVPRSGATGLGATGLGATGSDATGAGATGTGGGTNGAAVQATALPKASGKRGSLWKRVRAFLHSVDRAQGFDAILRAVADDAVAQAQQSHPLRVVLGRRVATGDLKVSPTGRYRLP